LLTQALFDQGISIQVPGQEVEIEEKHSNFEEDTDVSEHATESSGWQIIGCDIQRTER